MLIWENKDDWGHSFATHNIHMITRCLPRLFSIWYCQGSSLLVRVTSLLECSMVLCIWTMCRREGGTRSPADLSGNNWEQHLRPLGNVHKFFLCVELPETIDKQVEIVHKRLKQLTRGSNNWQEVETAARANHGFLCTLRSLHRKPWFVLAEVKTVDKQAALKSCH